MDVFENIRKDGEQALRELLDVSGLRAGQILVIGCSSSEMLGLHIGKGGSMDAARALLDGIYPLLKERGVYLAVQCCEHLNRAIIMERTAAERYGLDEVNVKPWERAGGSFATACWQRMEEPCAVEHVRAHAGMDIGDTIIGMHLREVAVPVRLSLRSIGMANLVCARTRPKYIGGERARYQE